jgi:quercetin dioxygenase-like cupin family protein
MADTTVTKVDSSHSPHGRLGQTYLASGKRVSLRLWDHLTNSTHKEDTVRDYETVGYVVNGHAKLHIEGQVITLNPGDSWVVPEGAHHHYEISDSFTAVEATSPPAQIHGRDEPHPPERTH